MVGANYRYWLTFVQLSYTLILTSVLSFAAHRGMRRTVNKNQFTKGKHPMANTDVLSFQLTDIRADQRNCVVHVPVGFTIAQLQSFADTFATALDNIVGPIITNITLTKNLTLVGGLDATPLAGHYNQFGSNTKFDVADSPYGYTMRIPGILESMVSGEVVDFSAGDGAIFASLITTGDGTIAPVNKFGLDLLSFLEAKASFHK